MSDERWAMSDERWAMSDERWVHKCHPELVSGSVRGEGQEKARGEMLKRVQHDEMIISMRRGNVGTSARNVPTPSPLTTLLRRICYSLFLSIRVCDPTTENMFFCSSVKRSHYSLLKSHCRFPSLQTADVCGTSEYHGFKNPRLFALTGIASFRRHYLYIITEKRKRLEDGNRKPSSSKTHYSKLITRN